ncbi:phage protein Gp36 family protein [Paracoccus sp. (in: a-proteobacteria)]|uniref:gp436 family protein n=1 Tax=Paracoccus sp. TaxID=267 RepID=UPI0028A5DB5C|nr:phage protein Gp36 family protein [Paracoccus sp. (in: a-proteobacteria)]
MSYASVDQLKAVIPVSDLELLTDFERGGEPSDTRLQQALTDATAEINGYIAKVVKRPLADTPQILTVICRDLAMHRLYLNLGHDMTSLDKVRKNWIDTLKSIQRGESAIGDDGDGPDQLTSPGVAMTDGPERLFTRNSLKGF